MQIFSLPRSVCGLVFDIDGTLYHGTSYAGDQIRVLIARLARERGVAEEKMAAQVEAYRQEHAAKNGGRRPSLGNTFIHFGVPIEQSVAWREEELEPERYLSTDSELDRLLGTLGERYRLVCVTNNPSSIGHRTLAALGVDRHILDVVGLDSTLRSKPNPLSFSRAKEIAGCDLDQMVSIGDRYEIDLEPALELGMGGILIEGRSDLFELPQVLAGAGRTDDASALRR